MTARCFLRSTRCGVVFVVATLFFSWTLQSQTAARAGDATTEVTAAFSSSRHWAFQPVSRPSIPETPSDFWADTQSVVDAFVINRLSAEGRRIPGQAERLTLVRRVTFDLIGLPPTPIEVAEFLSDSSPDAFEKLLDRLLANPHYGENWGRMWLDVVRFAETAGFNADPARPLAYKYRDYVIRSFNEDVGFDRFLQQQLAGDELFPDDAESQIATGYCRMWADESNASNILLARQIALNDLTSNLSTAVLGLSIGCAQCHDHKFDPILQSDFYQLQAHFSGIVLEDNRPVGRPDQLQDYYQKRMEWLESTSPLRRELHSIETPARIKMSGDKRMKFPPLVLEAIDTMPEERTAVQRQMAFWCERQMGYVTDDLPKHLDEDSKKRRDELLQKLSEAKALEPKPPVELEVMAVAELSNVPPKTHFLDGGSYDKPLDEVVPDIPVVMRSASRQSPPKIEAPHSRTSGRRSVLAHWISSPENTLTYRVWVNRIWQGHFGRGLVENANDFGVQSPVPEQSELLDWLASDFTSRQFSTKSLHRRLLTSNHYRQRSGNGETSTEFVRQRLTSERIRDAWLAVSGQLNDTMFGPGVRPELPPNFGGSNNWKLSDPHDRVRRSIYIYAKRNLPYPMMSTFDFPDMHEACGCRTSTTIAPQALMLLNSSLLVDAGQKLASRSIEECSTSENDSRIQRAWELVYGRPASPIEILGSKEFLSRQMKVIAESDSNRTGEEAGVLTTDDERAAFVDFCHALLNTNEFLFVE